MSIREQKVVIMADDFGGGKIELSDIDPETTMPGENGGSIQLHGIEGRGSKAEDKF